MTTELPCLLCDRTFNFDDFQRHLIDGHEQAEMLAFLALHMPTTSATLDVVLSENSEPDLPSVMPSLLRAIATDMETKHE